MLTLLWFWCLILISTVIFLVIIHTSYLNSVLYAAISEPFAPSRTNERSEVKGCFCTWSFGHMKQCNDLLEWAPNNSFSMPDSAAREWLKSDCNFRLSFVIFLILMTLPEIVDISRPWSIVSGISFLKWRTKTIVVRESVSLAIF